MPPMDEVLSFRQLAGQALVLTPRDHVVKVYVAEPNMARFEVP